MYSQSYVYMYIAVDEIYFRVEVVATCSRQMSSGLLQIPGYFEQRKVPLSKYMLTLAWSDTDNEYHRSQRNNCKFHYHSHRVLFLSNLFRLRYHTHQEDQLQMDIPEIHMMVRDIPHHTDSPQHRNQDSTNKYQFYDRKSLCWNTRPKDGGH